MVVVVFDVPWFVLGGTFCDDSGSTPAVSDSLKDALVVERRDRFQHEKIHARKRNVANQVYVVLPRRRVRCMFVLCSRIVFVGFL